MADLGIKTIIGKRNSGLLIGFGKMPITYGYEIGGQLSYKWFYFNAGYGVSSTYQSADNVKGRLTAFNINIGGMFNLGKEKGTFIDIGTGGFLGADAYKLNRNYTTNSSGLSFAFGIGYRW